MRIKDNWIDQTDSCAFFLPASSELTSGQDVAKLYVDLNNKGFELYQKLCELIDEKFSHTIFGFMDICKFDKSEPEYYQIMNLVHSYFPDFSDVDINYLPTSQLALPKVSTDPDKQFYVAGLHHLFVDLRDAPDEYLGTEPGWEDALYMCMNNQTCLDSILRCIGRTDLVGANNEFGKSQVLSAIYADYNLKAQCIRCLGRFGLLSIEPFQNLPVIRGLAKRSNYYFSEVW